MATATRHYESAFESYLRSRRAPFASVRGARRALLGSAAKLTVRNASGSPDAEHADGSTLKSFDFVLYGEHEHLLIEVKGRRVPARAKPDPRRRPRIESWVTLDDVESMRTWGRLFGEPFTPVFAFVYWCPDKATQAAFDERFECDGRRYGLLALSIDDYTAAMTPRSPRWRTVHVPAAAFDAAASPLLGADPALAVSPAAETVRVHADVRSDAQTGGPAVAFAGAAERAPLASLAGTITA